MDVSISTDPFEPDELHAGDPRIAVAVDSAAAKASAKPRKAKASAADSAEPA